LNLRATLIEHLGPQQELFRCHFCCPDRLPRRVAKQLLPKDRRHQERAKSKTDSRK